MKNFKKQILAAAIVLALPSTAKANMPVLDTSNLAKNAEMVAQTAELVSSAAEQLTELTNINTAIGLATDAISSTGAGKVLSSALGAANSLYKAYNTFQSVGVRVQHIGQNIKNLPDNFFTPLEQAKTVDGAFSAVNKLMTPNYASHNAKRQFETVTQAFSENASREAMAVAIYNRNDIATNSSSIFKDLSKTALGSETLKAQNASIQTLMLKLIEEQQQTRALLAAYVQMQAADKFHPRNYFVTGTKSPWSNPDAEKVKEGAANNVFSQ